ALHGPASPLDRAVAWPRSRADPGERATPAIAAPHSNEGYTRKDGQDSLCSVADLSARRSWRPAADGDPALGSDGLRRDISSERASEPPLPERDLAGALHEVS